MSRQANKRGLTLDLNSAPAAKKTRVTGLTPGNPPILTTPDVQMLKLSSPDVARFLSNPTLTPTTQTPYGFNKFVTEEQELYAKGFEDALNSVSSQERTTDISTIEKATAAHRSNLVIAAHAIANQPPLPVTTPMLSQAPPPAVVISAPTPSVLADISTSMHQSRPSSGASGSLDSSEANLPEGVRVKEEEDHDDDDDDDSSSKSGVGYSPVDMESQEKLKLERKRLRNRVAASKCRKKKLERISQLDEKVQGLKNENTELAAVVKKLKESVCNLKQEVIDHVNQGCQIVIASDVSAI
ncbi:transcription factor JunD-like [Tigriopus californicus]|uniref:transcription factor JunD-like n=1 Tax=Tigriopus californicus TaxID=6832 RepID=UPI0027DA7879|nr:transcription factor JunD-like [Tigriopus californicus]